jgi:hypothetical protein
LIKYFKRMKTQITFLIFLFLTSFIKAQIPGGNFETWQTAIFEYPDSANWTVYHEKSSPESIGLLEKSSDASDGNYAIKFNTYGTYDFGYVVYGQVGEEGPTGGIPFADDPTQVTIAYKCNMATGDSAQIWVWLYSGGSRITEDCFKVGGTHPAYKDTILYLSAYVQTPDSLMFAVVPCDPNVEEPRTDGNEVYFDNVRFNGTNTLQIPDNSFEIWATNVQDYTAEMYNIEALCEKSDDAYSGNFALKMTTINAEWDEEDDEIDRDSYLNMWGKKEWVQVSKADWEARIIGGLPVHARKDTLVFYYKYVPSAGVTDTAGVGLVFDKDSLEVYSYWDFLLATDTYTKFEIPYDLDNVWPKSSVDADSMILELESSKWRENWSPNDVNIEGSSLFIDYMYFKSQLYTITAIVGADGSVSPADTSVIQGDTLIFIITPDEGYKIDTASYNDEDISNDLVQADGYFTYAANNITENGNLYVSFEKKTYTITTTVGANGTVSPNDTSIIHGNPLTFTITPDQDYQIDSVSYNGEDISDDLEQSGNDFTYTIDNVTEDGNLYVSFKLTTGIKDNNHAIDYISIYPNPASDVLFITGAAKESIVQFISVTGAVIYQEKISDNTSINITHIPAGMYFVKINNSIKGRIIKK